MKISGALKKVIKKLTHEGLVLESQHPQNYEKAKVIIAKRQAFIAGRPARIAARKAKKEVAK